MSDSLRVRFVMLLLACALPCLAQQSPADWQAQVREHVAAKQFPAALSIVDGRLRETPGDLEARGWRARLLAWSGRWQEAEAEYRAVLDGAPNDVDILLGLSDVLLWQKRPQESLAVLDRATGLAPSRPEVYTRRGRALAELGRAAQARAAFREALSLDPANSAAQAGLESLEPAPRHELRIESDFDHYPFAEDAQSVTTSLRSDWAASPNFGFASRVAGNFQRRFGQDAGRFLADLTFRLPGRNALTVGGGAARDRGVIPRAEAFFEYGRGLRISERRFLRGMEFAYRQQWLWYRDARPLVLTPSVLVYLPREWTWSLSVAVARSRFPGTPAEWRPSGRTRLGFPLHRGLSGNLFFSVGTENFAQADQVGRFSAHTYGGGVRWRFGKRQDVGGYVFYQDRSQGRHQTGFGFSYGIRF